MILIGLFFFVPISSFEFDGEGCKVSHIKRDFANRHDIKLGNDVNEYLDGDLQVDPVQCRILMKGIESGQKRKKRTLFDFFSEEYPEFSLRQWETEIPYIMSGSHSSQQENSIRRALNVWQQETCIRFTEKFSDSDLIVNGETQHHILFTKGTGCISFTGKSEKKAHTIFLGDVCFNEAIGVIQHEIGHALGLWHETARPDRDEFVTINFDSVPSNERGDFIKLNKLVVNDLGEPYDYSSIMHFSSIFKTVNRNEKTIVPKSKLFLQTIGQRVEPSFSDIKKINLAYCASKCEGINLNCRNRGYIDPKDCSKCKCQSGFGGTLCENLLPMKYISNSANLDNLDMIKTKSCVFPFIYDGKRYNACTNIDYDRPWCSTTNIYSKSWIACDIYTEDHRKCVIPFYYKDSKYTSCTTKENGQVPWCALDFNHKKGFWGTCESEEITNIRMMEEKDCIFPLSGDGTIHPSCNSGENEGLPIFQLWCHVDKWNKDSWRPCDIKGTSKGYRCAFPFKYAGKEFSRCTKTDDSKFWCSLDETYTDRKDYCKHDLEPKIFEIEDDSCGGYIELGMESIDLTSFEYPYPYPIGQECTWKITAPETYKVKIKLNEVNLVCMRDAAFHWLEFRYNGSQSDLGPRFCDSSLTDVLISESNEVMILFNSMFIDEGDRVQNHPKRGFSITLNALYTCQGYECKNGGTCYSKDSSYTCDCVTGYFGQNCINKDKCLTDNPCKNGGTCRYDYQFDALWCECFEESMGWDCSPMQDKCSTENPCKNDGVCVYNYDTEEISCKCKYGFTGWNCDTPDNSCGGCNLIPGEVAYPCEEGTETVETTCSDFWNTWCCEEEIPIYKCCDSAQLIDSVKYDQKMCAVEGWAEWNECSATCGMCGKRKRRRWSINWDGNRYNRGHHYYTSCEVEKEDCGKKICSEQPSVNKYATRNYYDEKAAFNSDSIDVTFIDWLDGLIDLFLDIDQSDIDFDLCTNGKKNPSYKSGCCDGYSPNLSNGKCE